jgi:hypothetical protein
LTIALATFPCGGALLWQRCKTPNARQADDKHQLLKTHDFEFFQQYQDGNNVDCCEIFSIDGTLTGE